MGTTILPDFDDMIKLANEIGGIKTELMLQEAYYDQLKAEITDYVMVTESCWGGDKKCPSNAHIKDTFHVRGYDEETKNKLLAFVSKIANLTGELKAKENIFRVYENMIGVWRTESANQRYDNG
jgi:hypothetical protein